VIEEDLTAEEAKAAALCDQVNAVLEAAEENDTLSDELMEKSLQQFKARSCHSQWRYLLPHTDSNINSDCYLDSYFIEVLL